MHRLSRLFTPRLLYVLIAGGLPSWVFAQEADFPDVDVTTDSQDWFFEPIVWISAGVIFLLLFWIARRRRTTPK